MLKLLLDDNADNLGGGTPSTPSDANGQDSSTGQQDDNQSVDSQGDDQQQQAGDDQAPNDDGSGSSDGATGDDNAGDQNNDQQDSDDQQQQQAVSLETTEPVPDALVDKPGDEKLRFSDHPRWREVIAEKNQYKEQVANAQAAMEQTNALNNILSSNGIPAQEFQAALQYLILKRQNPQEAFRQLQRDYTVLGQLSGEVLPEDVQAQVAAGTLDPNMAREVARARAQGQYQQWQQQTQGQMQQYGVQQQVQQTTAQWTQLKQTVDPDFKPGSKLWQTVDLHLRSLPAPGNAMQAQLNCENAYKAAKEYLKGFGTPAQRNGSSAPRRPGQPPSRPSSPTNRVVVKTAADAINAIKTGGGRAPANIRYA